METVYIFKFLEKYWLLVLSHVKNSRSKQMKKFTGENIYTYEMNLAMFINYYHPRFYHTLIKLPYQF